MSSVHSLSSLWDSRFDDTHLSQRVCVETDGVRDDAVKASAILAAAGKCLPMIHPHELHFYSHLGVGSCFKVDCEVYTKEEKTSQPQLVAVKYLRLPRRLGPETSRFYDGVMRELRVLTHPSFRNHECLIEALAYGWSISPQADIHPYLVVEYSDHGTAFEYLQRITPPVDECRQLAVDVAVGLRALHHSDIIHGDLKPDNVLIFNCGGERPQVAKLADFGASIFNADFNESAAAYRGTARYNAPEQEGRLGYQAWEAAQTRDGFYRADMFSLGLLIWEFMNDGDDFCDPAWLGDDETELQWLDRVCQDEEDSLLSRARLFCEHRFRDLGQPIVKMAVTNALEVTLTDKAALRADVDTVIEMLSQGISKSRPKPVYPRIRSLPVLAAEEPVPQGAFKVPVVRTGKPADRRSRRQQKKGNISTGTTASDRVVNVFQESERIVRARQKPIIRLAATDPPRMAEPTTQVNGLSTIIRREQAPVLGRFSHQSLDIFQVFTTAAFPPWRIQRSIVDELKAQTNCSKPTIESADAYFQLSICYQTGFGVEPDATEAMRNLRNAISLNTVAQSVRHRLEIAYDNHAIIDPGFTTIVDNQLEVLVSSPHYFSRRIQIHQKALNHSTKTRTWKCDTIDFRISDLEHLDLVSLGVDCHQPCVSVGSHGVLARRDNLLDLAAEVGDATLSRRLVNEQRWSSGELATALIKSCEYGHFVTARFLASCCAPSQHETNEYSPLHWLVMFSDEEARVLATALVLGSASNNGVCKEMINSMPPPGSEPCTFPEHCLQLAGSPLHWAVGARNLALVILLVELGANVHQRWSYTRASEIDYPSHQRPSCTPFELAITLHLPEVVDVLWAASPPSVCAELLGSSTAIHCIGQISLPFLRRIIHGANHARALRETINALQACGFDIRSQTTESQSMFLSALANPDQEPYVLQEILAAIENGRGVTADGKNGVTLVAATSSRRQWSVQRMILAADVVADVNDTDCSGWNALHYLAVEDNARLCGILLQRDDLELNKPNGKGATALHIAATFDAGAVLRLLLGKGADPELLNSDGQSPLASSVSYRRRTTTKILIEAGAAINLGKFGGASKTSVLHLAVSGPSSSESFISHLLDTFSQLRDPSQLNLEDGLGWTPLHRAAYFGDHEGIAALLKYGADREVQCQRRFPIAPGRTALDVTVNLLHKMNTNLSLGPDHARISKGGAPAIAAFKSRLEEVKIILSQKASNGSETSV